MEKRVLLIDGDLSFCQTIAKVTRLLPVQLTTVNLGESALEEATQSRPHLIVLNAELPDMNGFMVCKKLRETEETVEIPIILTSGKARTSDFEKHQKLRARADIYLKKPISEALIYNHMTNLLGLHVADSTEHRILEDPELGQVVDFHSNSEEEGTEEQNLEASQHLTDLREALRQKESELSHLKQHSDLLEDHLSELEGQYDQAQQTIEQLRRDLEHQRRQAVQGQEEQDSLDALHSELREIKSERHNLQLEEARARESLEQALADNEALNKQLQQVQDQRHKTEEQLAATKAALETLQSEQEEDHREQQTSLKSLTSQVNRLKTTIEELEQTLATEREEHQKSQQQTRKECAGKVEAMENELKQQQDASNQKVDALRDTLQQLKAKLADRENQLDSLAGEQVNIEKSLRAEFEQKLQREIVDTESKRESFEQKVQELGSEKQKLESALEEAKSQLERAKQNHSKELSELNKQQDAKISEIEQQLEELSENEHSNQLLIDTKEAEIERLEEILESQKKKLEDEQEANAANLARTESQMQALKREHHQQQEEQQKVARETSTALQECREKLAKMEGMNEELSQLKAKKAKLDKRQRQLKEQLGEALKLIENED